MKSEKLNQAQLNAFAYFLIEVSKAIALFIALGLLFPQSSVTVSPIKVIIGIFLCLICLVGGIIVLKGVKKNA